MELNEYQELAARTLNPLPTREDRLLHAALGAGSEVGEFAKAMMVCYSKNDPEGHNVVEELGDVFWYLSAVCVEMGWRFEDLLMNSANYFHQLNKDFGIDRFKSVQQRYTALAYYVGEIQTLVKSNAYYKKEIDAGAMSQAVAMSITSVSIMARFFNFNPEDVAKANIEKLNKRYPEKFTIEHAVARLDKI